MLKLFPRYFISAYLFIAIIALAACGRHSSAWQEISRADELIETRPDSSLTILSNVKYDELVNDDERAKYALIMSMALDKNYIDTTTFDVLQPAIDYYADHGTANDKLRTFYYQGRIYQNAGQNNDAMKAFVSALDLKSQATDTLTIARALIAQAIIFNNAYNFTDAVLANLEAANLHGRIGRHELRADVLLRALNAALLNEGLCSNNLNADSIMQICEAEKDYIPFEIYTAYRLSYLQKHGSREELLTQLSQLEQISPLTLDSKLMLANTYQKIDEPQKALDVLDKIDASSLDIDSARYISIKIQAYDKLGDSKNCLDNYKTFYTLISKEILDMFENKLHFSEEKHKLELQAQKEAKKKDDILFASISGGCILGLIIVVLLLFIRKNKIAKRLAIQKEIAAKLENENLLHKIGLIENERDELAIIMEKNAELPDEVNNAVKTRIEMLNSILAYHIVAEQQPESTYATAVKEMLGDTSAFMNTTRLAFKASHPRFIQYFVDQGLTDDEINYVCLYAIGLRGKDVGAYMKKRSHVNISSAIRKKLGIDKHETNIGIYVRRLLKEL